MGGFSSGTGNGSSLEIDPRRLFMVFQSDREIMGSVFLLVLLGFRMGEITDGGIGFDPGDFQVNLILVSPLGFRRRLLAVVRFAGDLLRLSGLQE